MALAADIDPFHYGELVQFGAVLPWDTGARTDGETASVSQGSR